MADDPQKPQEPLAEEINQALDKLNLQDVDFLRPLMPEDISYLLSHCPFLQMISANDMPALDAVDLRTAPSNWVIHHYGDAMSSSPGKLLFAGGDFRLGLGIRDGGGSSGTNGSLINLGKGTLWNQAFVTAQHMMALARQFGWAGVNIVDGHPLMQWAAWMYAQDEGMHLSGYEPDEQAHAKRKRLKRSDTEEITLLKEITLNVRPRR